MPNSGGPGGQADSEDAVAVAKAAESVESAFVARRSVAAASEFVLFAGDGWHPAAALMMKQKPSLVLWGQTASSTSRHLPGVFWSSPGPP